MLRDLQPERIYRVEGFEGEAGVEMNGRELIEEGVRFEGLEEEGGW